MLYFARTGRWNITRGLRLVKTSQCRGEDVLYIVFTASQQVLGETRASYGG